MLAAVSYSQEEWFKRSLTRQIALPQAETYGSLFDLLLIFHQVQQE